MYTRTFDIRFELGEVWYYYGNGDVVLIQKGTTNEVTIEGDRISISRIRKPESNHALDIVFNRYTHDVWCNETQPDWYKYDSTTL